MYEYSIFIFVERKLGFGKRNAFQLYYSKAQHDYYQMFKKCAGSQVSAKLILRIRVLWFFRLSGNFIVSGHFERTFRLFLQGLRISS